MNYIQLSSNYVRIVVKIDDLLTKGETNMNVLDEYLNLSGQYEKLNDGEIVRKGEASGPIILTYNPDLDLYTAKYRSGGEDFSNPYIRAARGLTIDPEGNVVLREFDKFSTICNWKHMSHIANNLKISILEWSD